MNQVRDSNNVVAVYFPLNKTIKTPICFKIQCKVKKQMYELQISLRRPVHEATYFNRKLWRIVQIRHCDNADMLSAN